MNTQPLNIPSLARRFTVYLPGFLIAVVCLIDSAAFAQSGSGIVYPQGSPYPQGRIIQSSPLQGSGTIIQSRPIQGAVTQGSATQGSAIRAQETFESKFWQYLNEARYREWAPVAGTTGEAYEGQSPHGAMIKMYLNRRAAGRPDELPAGSVVVKENYGADGKTLMAVTTMYRPKTYKGWYWTKYNPDGSVATKDGKRLAGQVKGCIDCHAGAGGNDDVFFND